MKKTYQNPKITIVNIQVAEMINTSPGYSTTTTTTETSGNLGKEREDNFEGGMGSLW